MFAAEYTNPVENKATSLKHTCATNKSRCCEVVRVINVRP
jgi:hypothetical protein